MLEILNINIHLQEVLWLILKIDSSSLDLSKVYLHVSPISH
jgi:hypothetical protein